MYLRAIHAFSVSVNAIRRSFFKSQFYKSSKYIYELCKSKYSITVVKIENKIYYLYDDDINRTVAHCIEQSKRDFLISQFLII